jgi:hypothetical protein
MMSQETTEIWRPPGKKESGKERRASEGLLE